MKHLLRIAELSACQAFALRIQNAEFAIICLKFFLFFFFKEVELLVFLSYACLLMWQWKWHFLLFCVVSWPYWNVKKPELGQMMVFGDYSKNQSALEYCKGEICEISHGCRSLILYSYLLVQSETRCCSAWCRFINVFPCKNSFFKA